MKTTKRHGASNIVRRQGGFTLIEITMVIALILLLIGILTLSMRAYKDGSDKAGCLMNISNVQKAVRSEASLNDLYEGDTLQSTSLVGTRKYFEVLPSCPGRGTYTYLNKVPGPGVLFSTCSKSTDSQGPKHIPSDTRGW